MKQKYQLKYIMCKNCKSEKFTIERGTPDDWFLYCESCATTICLVHKEELDYYGNAEESK